jgi:hypothetical protein
MTELTNYRRLRFLCKCLTTLGDERAYLPAEELDKLCFDIGRCAFASIMDSYITVQEFLEVETITPLWNKWVDENKKTNESTD